MSTIANDLKELASSIAVKPGEGEAAVWKRGRRRRARRRVMSGVGIVAAFGATTIISIGLSSGDDDAVIASESPTPVDDGTFPNEADRQSELGQIDGADPALTPTADAYQRLAPFVASAHHPGRWELEHYSTLHEMTTWASAVIVGRVVGFDDPYVFQSDELEFDTYTIARARVAVDEVLSGDLDPRWGTGEIVLAWMGGQPTDSALDTPMVWFLRDYTDPDGPHVNDRTIHEDEIGLYRLVSSQGLFLATPDGRVVAPTSEFESFEDALVAGRDGALTGAEPSIDPVLQEIGDRELSIDELVDEITKIGAERVEPW